MSLANLAKIITLFPLVLLLSIVLPGQARSDKTRGQLISVDGGRLWMESRGKGGPVVVLDYGLGGPITTWRGVFPEIAKFTKVIQYHRAGYGYSDAPTSPRSFTNVAKDMREMLKSANIPAPYVLVGHSLGNAHIRAFAHLYPDEVAGVVFIDPINARVFEVATEAEKAEDEKGAKEFEKTAPEGAKAEMHFMASDSDFSLLRSFTKLPDVPVVLLVAGRHEAGPVWTRSVVEEYGPFVYASPEGSMIVDPESGHYVHRDNPALAISAIRRVVFPSLSRRLGRLLKTAGVVAAIEEYRKLRRSYPSEYFNERLLNSLGHQQLRANDAKGAIELFKLNVEMYPKAANAYDSLAYAYVQNGQTSLAIRNYRRSLVLNPQNTNAEEILKRLNSRK